MARRYIETYNGLCQRLGSFDWNAIYRNQKLVSLLLHGGEQVWEIIESNDFQQIEIRNVLYVQRIRIRETPQTITFYYNKS